MVGERFGEPLDASPLSRAGDEWARAPELWAAEPSLIASPDSVSPSATTDTCSGRDTRAGQPRGSRADFELVGRVCGRREGRTFAPPFRRLPEAARRCDLIRASSDVAQSPT